ncbi:MAG: chemotaxis protein CheB [Planctomycetaceae bacterium]|nr:chemotaxis protein CheB [Planctomycetaceae bacterium]
MKRDIIVVGATIGSAGDLGALLEGLPRDFPAAVLAVVHMATDQPPIVQSVVEASSRLPVVTPERSEKIVPGKVYLASPDRHLLVEKGRVLAFKSPQENLHRPAIDPLFRSAAYYYGPRVVGLVLSKSDCDGTSGMHAIKERKGLTILRNPVEGHMPVMPWSIERHIPLDYEARLAEIPRLLIQLADGRGGKRREGGSSHAQ